MEVLILAVLIGLIPALIAKGKGRSFGLWWFYGAALFIVALPHSLIMKANTQAIERQKLSEGMRKCPYCAELVKSEALICRYCQKELPPLPPKGPAATVYGNLSYPIGTPIDIWKEGLMNANRVQMEGDRYLWNGNLYDSFDLLLSAMRETRAMGSNA